MGAWCGVDIQDEGKMSAGRRNRVGRIGRQLDMGPLGLGRRSIKPSTQPNQHARNRVSLLIKGFENTRRYNPSTINNEAARKGIPGPGALWIDCIENPVSLDRGRVGVGEQRKCYAAS